MSEGVLSTNGDEMKVWSLVTGHLKLVVLARAFFGKSYLFEIDLFQIDLLEIELLN